jgi:CcmD family protein
MKMFTIAFLLLLVLASVNDQAFAQQPPGSPPQIEGFVPVDTLPPTEQLPAARLLIVAYAFVWVVAFGYVWSLWRRLGKVEGELQQLAKRTNANTR